MKAQTGALGVFEFVDDAIRAARKLKEEGYQVHGMTPTYYHDLEDLLDPSRSGVRWVTLAGALLGCIGGFTLCIWTSLDWPIVTGGKEIISIPPFVVIGFECTILIGSLFNLVAMLGFSGLPKWVSEEGYDRRFSLDRIGLWVPTSAEQAEKAAAVLKGEGAEEARVASR